MVYENRRPDVAVFIDFENVYVSVRDKLDANPNFETIMDRCDDLGRVVIARAYADWYRYPRVTSALYANGIEPMYVPTYYYDKEMGRTGRAIKNSVDMNLCIDAMKTLFTNTNIAKFVLVTGDRDFIPLVNSIRQQGKEVIIIGIGGAASAHLAQSADEFVFYEQLVGKPSAAASAQPRVVANDRGRAPEEVTAPDAAKASGQEALAEKTVYDVLIDAIHLVRKRGYVSTLGSLKLVMKELMGGDFKESRYRDLNGRPFAKFKDFVLDAEKRGKVIIFTSGTVNEVFLPHEDPHKLSQFAVDLKEEPADTIIDEAVMNNGFAREPDADLVETASAAPPPHPTGRRRRRRSRSQRQAAKQEQEALIADVGAEEDEAGAPGAEEVPGAGVPTEMLEEVLEGVEMPVALEEQFSGYSDGEEPSDGTPPRMPPEALPGAEGPEVVEEYSDSAAIEEEPAEGFPPEMSPEVLHAAEVPEAVAEPEPASTGEGVETQHLASAGVEEVLISVSPAESAEDTAMIDATSPGADWEAHAPEHAAAGVAPTEAPPSDEGAMQEIPPVDEANVQLNIDEALALSAIPEHPVESETVEEPVAAVAAMPEAAPGPETGAEPGAGPPAESEAEPSDSEAIAEELALTEHISFSDAEWHAFGAMMAGFSKPASFAQIFDALRELRKQQEITRTNEQLRTMVKQAINNGMLERSGRGKRVYYKLKQNDQHSETSSQDRLPITDD